MKIHHDQIKRLGKLLGLHNRYIKQAIASKSYEELKQDAEAYHKVRMKLKLNHLEMRNMLDCRNTNLQDLARKILKNDP